MTLATMYRRGGKAASVVLALCEVALRVLFSEQLVIHQYPLAYKPDHYLGYTYAPRSEGRVRLPDIDAEFRIDSAGLIESKSLSRDRARPTLMIVGDSDATGLWLSDGEPFPILLDGMLKAAGCNVDVLNASVDGANRTLEKVRLAERRVEEMKPNFVALFIDVPLRTMSQMRRSYKGYVIMYPGDIPNGHLDAERQVDYVAALATFQWLYSWSYTFRALCRAALRYLEDERLSYLQGHIIDSFRGALRGRHYSLYYSMRALERLQAQIASYGGKLLLVDRPNGRLAQLASEHALNFVPFTYPSDARHHARLDGHLNAAGHAQVAKDMLAPLLAACRTLSDQNTLYP